MLFNFTPKIGKSLVQWLMRPVDAPREMPLSDFERIKDELRPCDVLLIEGRSRVSSVIKAVTQSAWSHSAIYIGRNFDIQDPLLRQKIDQFYEGKPGDALVVESLMGRGVIVTSLDHYASEHIRICRPKGLTRKDGQRVIAYVVERLGLKYDVRHIFDLMRFLLPWSILPSRWRSSLFSRHAGKQTQLSCSVLLVEAFESVHFPILPLFKPHATKVYEVEPRNSRLFTPSDFDYSPFFEIIKYPIVEFADSSVYHMLRTRGENGE